MSGFPRARAFALSLPGASEEPHFDMSSFRVTGKIFATVPPGEEFLHVFVDEAAAETYVAEDPAAFAPLLWGQQARGLRISLAVVDDARLEELIEESWRRKAPKRLLAEWDQGRDLFRERSLVPGPLLVFPHGAPGDIISRRSWYRRQLVSKAAGIEGSHHAREDQGVQRIFRRRHGKGTAVLR